MSSTSSSAERGNQKRSATQVLASRYRHLFVLPSAPLLLLYAGIVSLFLNLASRGTLGIVSFLPALVVFVLSVSAVSSALLIADKKTIATFRRVSAILLTGEILWLFCAACGIVYSWLWPTSYALTTSILFGAFVCAGLEFFVINGVFTRSTTLSLGLAAIHPTSTIATVRFAELSSHFDFVVLSLGVLAFGIIASFTLLMKRRKTSRGYDALRLFQSFMKTWAAGEPSELEAIISDHSEEAQVQTKVLRFRTQTGDTFIVLPGVHPGPFHPIGSYDLPGVFSKAFEDLGHVMTLHMPGGHERNLATTNETTRYATQVSEFAKAIDTSVEEAKLRGPIHFQIGQAKVAASAFSRDLILAISFAPLGSDDLSAGIEQDLAPPGRDAGFETYIVDAHNSINHEQAVLDTKELRWHDLIQHMAQLESMPFRVAYSHSSELGFPSGKDLTENGIGLMMFEQGRTKSVLMLADANNAVPSLRAEVSRALEQSGYSLMEFCTSDSHNLAARGLTVSRGYQALGEDTSVETIGKLAVDMARLADSRLLPAAYGSGRLVTKANIFGPGALEEFAAMTQASSRFGRYYLRFAGAAVCVLLLLSFLL